MGEKDYSRSLTIQWLTPALHGHTFKQFGSIHTRDLLGVNYCMDYLLNNGLYCTKRVHSHLFFGLLVPGVKSSIMGWLYIFHDYVD